jgi:hypothetical protein
VQQGKSKKGKRHGDFRNFLCNSVDGINAITHEKINRTPHQQLGSTGNLGTSHFNGDIEIVVLVDASGDRLIKSSVFCLRYSVCTKANFIQL